MQIICQRIPDRRTELHSLCRGTISSFSTILNEFAIELTFTAPTCQFVGHFGGGTIALVDASE